MNHFCLRSVFSKKHPFAGLRHKSVSRSVRDVLPARKVKAKPRHALSNEDPSAKVRGAALRPPPANLDSSATGVS